MNHGTSSMYGIGKCRCQPCTEAYRKTQARWKYKNPDYYSAYMRSWYKTETGQKHNRAMVAKNRAVKKMARIGSLQDLREYAEVLRGDPCSYCGQPMQHVDHIQPLSKGGEHSPDNLTAACQRCNDSKSAKSLLEFLLV